MMKKRAYILFVFIGLLVQCSASRPKDILDEEMYKAVLKEIILANQLQKNAETQKIPKQNYKALVYKKYGIDSFVLKKTTDYYSRHPEILARIYLEIEQEFQQKADSLEPTQKPLRKHTDKIKLPKKKLNLKKS